MRRFLRENSLSLVFLTFFVLAVAAQAIAGWDEFNNDATAHSEAMISLGRYLTSSSFGNALLENWQSEYLQFTLYILLTVWFVQRGSPESKELDKAGGESDEDQLVGELLGGDAAELAVRVPRGRLDGGVLDLPAPARLAGVQAGRSRA